MTLDFQGRIFYSHGLGMGKSIDLEWKRCELDTMLDAQWACSWATVHGKYIAQVMGRCETVTVSNLLVHVWAVPSRGWSECLVKLLPHLPVVECVSWSYCCRSDHPTWWRHQMEAFSALLALCAGNSPVPGEFPAQRPVTRSFDAFFYLRLNKRLSKQSWGWWFETLLRPLWRHRNGLIILVELPTSQSVITLGIVWLNIWIYCCRVFAQAQGTNGSFTAGMRMRTALTAALYRKVCLVLFVWSFPIFSNIKQHAG